MQIVADATNTEYLYAFGGNTKIAPGSVLMKMRLDGTEVWSNANSALVTSAAIDADGSIYATGTFANSADLDNGSVWADGRDLVTALGAGIFVAKWNDAGELQWSRAISSTSGGVGTTAGDGGIAVANGVVYTGGNYHGTLSLGGLTDDRIDPTSGWSDGFLAAYDTAGNFQSVAHFVDAIPKFVRAVGSDLYVSANFGYQATLNPGSVQTVLTPSYTGQPNLAIAKMSYNNTSPTPTWTLNWVDPFVATYNPSLADGATSANGLEVSGTDLYVSGGFSGTTDFDPSSGTYNLTAANDAGNIFALKLNASTGAFGWASQMGGTGRVAYDPQATAGLVLTPTGIYLGGYVVSGPVYFVGADHLANKIMDAGGLDHDAFLAKLGTDGSYQWSFGVGAVGRTIDDGDPGYSESGTGWTTSSSSVAFDGESRTHAKGTGTNTATWTFTGLPNGTYQVVTLFTTATTYTKGKKTSTPAYASNAPFRVNGSLVTVDQTTAPTDFAFFFDINGTYGKNLGTTAVTNGTLTVVLSDAANGTLIADAMRIWFVAPPVATPVAPQISSFTANPSPVSAGAPFTLNAAVSDSNSGGVVVQVAFYQDFNVDGILQRGTDLLLGYGAKNADGTWSLTFDMTALASGSYTFFAVALDDYGVFSDPFKLNLQVL